LIEVLLGLEYRSTDERIKPTLHFGHAPLKIESPNFDPKFFDQQLAEIGLNLVVPWTDRQMAQKLKGTVISSQGALRYSPQER
jgi:hypothetical protein